MRLKRRGDALDHRRIGGKFRAVETVEISLRQFMLQRRRKQRHQHGEPVAIDRGDDRDQLVEDFPLRRVVDLHQRTDVERHAHVIEADPMQRRRNRTDRAPPADRERPDRHRLCKPSSPVVLGNSKNSTSVAPRLNVGMPLPARAGAARKPQAMSVSAASHRRRIKAGPFPRPARARSRPSAAAAGALRTD